MYSGFGKFQKLSASFLNIFSKKMPSGLEGILLQGVSFSSRFLQFFLVLELFAQLVSVLLVFGIFDVLRHSFQIPDETDGLEATEDVIGYVNLPPEEALACSRFVIVVVIMPAFAQGNESKPEAVSRFIVRFITLGSDFVHDGVDRECSVVQYHGAEEEAHEQGR